MPQFAFLGVVSTGANDGWCLWLCEWQLIELENSQNNLGEAKVDAALSSRTRLTKRSLALAVASSLLSACRDTVCVPFVVCKLASHPSRSVARVTIFSVSNYFRRGLIEK